MPEIFNVIIPLVLIAVLITVFIVTQDDDKKKKGPRHARTDKNVGAAAGALKAWAVRSRCRVLGPVTLSKNGRTAHLDAVLVGWFGVLGLKSFGYNGQVYGNAGDAQWLWVSAGKRENFANPIDECALAARLMREALMGAGVRSPLCEATYVFTDPKVELCIPRSVGAMKLREFKSYLRKDKFAEDKGYDLDVLCRALEPFADKTAG